mgnify:CR=1 FL=1
MKNLWIVKKHEKKYPCEGQRYSRFGEIQNSAKLNFGSFDRITVFGCSKKIESEMSRLYHGLRCKCPSSKLPLLQKRLQASSHWIDIIGFFFVLVFQLHLKQIYMKQSKASRKPITQLVLGLTYFLRYLFTVSIPLIFRFIFLNSKRNW